MRPLLSPPSPALARDLTLLDKAIRIAMPLKGKHRAALPYDVQELSNLLTVDRANKQGYWSAPRFLSAYLNYFLPWNALRLSYLLPALPLSLKAGSRILDLGSGPLTLPLGLWLARPQLRSLPLTLTCTDLSPRPMELGRDILSRLQAGQTPTPPSGAVGDDAPAHKPAWQVRTERGSIEAALRSQQEKQHLICAGNVLNELTAERGGTLESRLEGIFQLMQRALTKDGQILLIEPGTRLGGKTITAMRQLAIDNGFRVLSPCPHQGKCPTQEERYSGWCHFSFGAQGASAALQALSQAAQLEKQNLHLSFILLERDAAARQKAEQNAENWDDDFADWGMEDDAEDAPAKQSRPYVPAPPITAGPMSVRIISDPIRIEGQTDRARYCCTEQGLGLLQHAERIPSGTAVTASPTTPPRRDAKSGAVILEPDAAQLRAAAQSAAPQVAQGAAPARPRPKARPEGTPTKPRATRPANAPARPSAAKPSATRPANKSGKATPHKKKR